MSLKVHVSKSKVLEVIFTETYLKSRMSDLLYPPVLSYRSVVNESLLDFSIHFMRYIHVNCIQPVWIFNVAIVRPGAYSIIHYISTLL